MNYTLADFLIRIKNAYGASRRTVDLPYSKYVESIGQILVKEGYIKGLTKNVTDGKPSLTAELLYKSRQPALTDVTIVSKPSIRKYLNKTQVKKTLHQYGMSVVSTSQGIMTNKMAAEMI
jgi:small subunit ribosomal protein S8